MYYEKVKNCQCRVIVVGAGVYHGIAAYIPGFVRVVIKSIE